MEICDSLPWISIQKSSHNVEVYIVNTFTVLQKPPNSNQTAFPHIGHTPLRIITIFWCSAHGAVFRDTVFCVLYVTCRNMQNTQLNSTGNYGRRCKHLSCLHQYVQQFKKTVPNYNQPDRFPVPVRSAVKSYGTTVDGWPAPKVTRYVNYNSHLNN